MCIRDRHWRFQRWELGRRGARRHGEQARQCRDIAPIVVVTHVTSRALIAIQLTPEFGERRIEAIEVVVLFRLGISIARLEACLLYTSDAADERSSVDLGGRR